MDFWLSSYVEPVTLKKAAHLQIDWRQEKGTLFSLIISLGHSSYLTFPIIVSFRKLLPPFTLTAYARDKAVGFPNTYPMNFYLSGALAPFNV